MMKNRHPSSERQLYRALYKIAAVPALHYSIFCVLPHICQQTLPTGTSVTYMDATQLVMKEPLPKPMPALPVV